LFKGEKMFPEERKAAILKLIQSGNPVKVGELCQQFEVSESTIRRDLQEMDAASLIQRTHGGAISAQLGYELSFREKEIRLLDEKRKIAKLAADMVGAGETVLLDSGTTTLEIARALVHKEITLATNSMDIAQVFGDDSPVEVLVLGGAWRKSTRSLVGYLTNETLGRIHFDKVFLAANGVDGTLGVTTPNSIEAETKRRFVQAGEEIILVVDHTKIGQQGLYQICSLDEIDQVITDEAIEPESLEMLRSHTKVSLTP
jgi:DeoR family transcriptional regulator, fructose operon transcriptional repressor